MKKALRGLLNWLERKFPDRVEVTTAEYKALNERVKLLESKINTMGMAMGFGGSTGIVESHKPFTR